MHAIFPKKKTEYLAGRSESNASREHVSSIPHVSKTLHETDQSRDIYYYLEGEKETKSKFEKI